MCSPNNAPYDPWAEQQYFARRELWCVRHRVQYSGHVTSCGIGYWCEPCDQEWIARTFAEPGIPIPDPR